MEYDVQNIIKIQSAIRGFLQRAKNNFPKPIQHLKFGPYFIFKIKNKRKKNPKRL